MTSVPSLPHRTLLYFSAPYLTISCCSAPAKPIQACTTVPNHSMPLRPDPSLHRPYAPENSAPSNTTPILHNRSKQHTSYHFNTDHHTSCTASPHRRFHSVQHKTTPSLPNLSLHLRTTPDRSNANMTPHHRTCQSEHRQTLTTLPNPNFRAEPASPSKDLPHRTKPCLVNQSSPKSSETA